MAAGEDERWRVEVVVVPKPGVNDPEGASILAGLHGLGSECVAEVRAGRLFRLVVLAPDATAARSAVGEMCDRLLANPVVEVYEVRSVEAAPAPPDLAGRRQGGGEDRG